MSEPDADAEVGYAAALRELEAILAELEDDHVDVDLLATKVKRAAELIALCRGRIEAARMEVDRVVAGLEEPTADGG
jgi:exodeoxyribonuclease VII small subunit